MNKNLVKKNYYGIRHVLELAYMNRDIRRLKLVQACEH